MAYQAQRAGVAERWPAPAGQQSLAVARALLAYDDPRRHAVALAIGRLATPPAPATFSRLPSVPGIGMLLRRVLLYALHDSRRVPRGQDGRS
jgi:hypothetical protein